MQYGKDSNGSAVSVNGEKKKPVFFVDEPEDYKTPTTNDTTSHL